MKLFQSIAFRIWIIFTVLGLLISIPLAIYYNDVQFQLLQQHTKEEFETNARITSNAVKTAVEMDDLTVLSGLLDDLDKNENYVFVAIVENKPGGKKEVFTCKPKLYIPQVLSPDTNTYNYSFAPFSTELMTGEVVIASSKTKDLEVLKELNRPLFYLSGIAVAASTLLFGLSLLFLSRPIFRAADIARELSQQRYDVEIPELKGNNEISVLNSSLNQLKENLMILDKENKRLMANLQDRIVDISADIKNKNTINSVLLQVSRIFLESSHEERSSVIVETFHKVTAGLDLPFMAILQLAPEQVSCQYKNEACPLYKLFSTHTISISQNELDQMENDLKIIKRDEKGLAGFVSVIFDELSGVRTIYEYVQGETGGNREVIILISEEETLDFQEEEIKDLLQVYFSLYTNYRRGKDLQNELTALNKTLESKVLEKTRVNLEISNSLISQDKLATIGELAAGVAHDLNTPLGAIKAASQNMRVVNREILQQLKVTTTDDLTRVFELIHKIPDEPVEQSSLLKLKKAEILQKVIHSVDPSIDSIGLSKLFVEAGFTPEHVTEMEEVLELSDPSNALIIIKNMKLLNSFLLAIDTSVERSSSVVSNLSLFSREDLTQKKEQIDLNHSIRIIEALFRYRLSGKIDLITEVPPGSFILGIEMRLFQVWTNLVKNAIDAFEESTRSDKYIRIYSETAESSISVHFENNGPRIPEEDMKRIFKKFFTTKQKSNGTGLGLSIVSNIVAEHYGKLSLTSDDERTVFTVTFPKG